ncbi:MAG: hypothetical protein KTR15_05900 [Phycisphaeraceae bacterium]|nr:hypothetical protein [Phycisphaeraceae bacterium]
MPSQRSHLLCITLTPSSADLAEVRRSGSGVQVIRRSTLAFPDSIGMDQPAALGKALAEHIEQTGYTERHAVIGLCSRWVLTRHKRVPPADADTMRGICNLQIEREFAGSAAEMTFDYQLAEGVDAENRSPLLLAGIHAKILRQVEQIADAAGLKADAITPATLAAANGQNGVVIQVEHGAAGVMRVSNAEVVALASCPADPSRLDDPEAQERLLSDLSRSVLQLPGDEGGSGVSLMLPTSVGADDARALADALAERVGKVGLIASDPAVLLAIYATEPSTAMIDFAASRLRPPKQSRVSPSMRWAIRAAAIVLLIIGVAGYLWMDATSHRDGLQAQYDTIKDKAESLDQVRADANLASVWYDKRPQTLDAMLELTRTFPSRGEIRVETLTLRADMSGQIDCSAEDRETMDDYFSKMQESRALLQINRGSVRPVGGNSTWINFPIAFSFDPAAMEARQ